MENYLESPLSLLVFEYSKDGRLDDLVNLLKLNAKHVRKAFAESIFDGW